MNETLQKKYYLIIFKMLQKEYYTFWYTDDSDGFLLNENGLLKSFPTKEKAIAFANEEGFLLDESKFIISSAILKKNQYKKINCSLFLDYWNIFSDIAHSINCRFIGDARKGTIQHIYDKLFYGCNILIKENEEHYRPVWNNHEKHLIAKVMKDGFKILQKGLDTG